MRCERWTIRSKLTRSQPVGWCVVPRGTHPLPILLSKRKSRGIRFRNPILSGSDPITIEKGILSPFGSGSTRSFFPNEPDNIRGAVENILYLSRIPVRISTYPVLYETEIFGPFRGPSPGSRTQRSDWFSHGTTIRDVQLPPTPVIGPRWVHVSQRIENIRMPRRKSTLLGISQQTLLDQRGENSMICRRHKRIERPPRYTPNRSKFRFGGVIDDIG